MAYDSFSRTLSESDSADVSSDETKDESLLTEIRERYNAGCEAWADVWEEAETDMRYVAGDPWDDADKRARADAGRPCINHDEINQYVNQAANQQRMNPVGIVVHPAGEGADDDTAELHEKLIRAIEYRSRAAHLVYTPAFEGVLQNSLAFFKVTRRYVNDDTDDQEIILKGIPNYRSVVFDFAYQEVDGSDAEWCFLLEPMRKEEFTRKFPDARKTSFNTDDIRVAPEWIKGDIILVAAYYRVEREPYTGKSGREVQKRTVKKYITNGVEILEKYDELGSIIPVIPEFGKELWINSGGQAKRKLVSLVRLARDPQMSLAFITSQQMEEASLTPRVPWVGYKGQFESDEEAWKTAHKVPHAFLQADPMVDEVTHQMLPLPQRNPFVPNFVAYESAKESCRRAIQAAMGIMPLPTSAQRQNEKSGIALQKIQSQQQIGSFHFVDNHHMAMQLAGRVIEEWIPFIYGGERKAPLHDADGTRTVAMLNAAVADEKTGEQTELRVGEGDHDITISTGPSNDSTREAADDMLQTIVSNGGQLPPPGSPQAKLMALAIKGKQLGPLGDKMVEIIDPPQDEPMPPQAQQMIGQAKQAVQALNAQCQQLEAKIQQLEAEKQGRVVDNQFKVMMEKMKEEHDIAMKEIETKAQNLQERTAWVEDMWQQLHGQAHEVAMAAQSSADQQQQQASQAQQMQAAQAPQAQQPAPQDQTAQPASVPPGGPAQAQPQV
jgi:hypothetical protein